MPLAPSMRESITFPEKGEQVRCAFRLTSEIVALSEADNWDDAKTEWALAAVYFAEVPGTCLCGHYPIVEMCVLANQKNGNEAVVGNVCVTKFLGLPSDSLFAALNRITQDPARALNKEMIAYVYRKGWLNDWERDFYLDTCRKRILSDRQRAKRVQLNQSILQWMAQAGGT